MVRLVVRRLVDLLVAVDGATGRQFRTHAPRWLRSFVLRHRQPPGPAPLGYTESSSKPQYAPPAGLLPRTDPLNIEVSAAPATRPCLNVLLPTTSMNHMTGGPNTALILAVQLARLGIPVRLVNTDRPPDRRPERFFQHLAKISTFEATSLPLEVVNASDRRRPLVIGRNDVFLATAWWTAQLAKYAVRHTAHSRFVYLIQDYETLLHPASSAQALAEETYALDHIPVINAGLLYEFLVTRSIGRFANKEFAEQALVFEPAVDTDLFFPEARERSDAGKRRLFFYARPYGGARNLFELGIAALQKLVFEGAIDPSAWEFIGMGEAFDPVDLGRGARLRPTPWLGLEGYARQLRQADVLLSLMLSPHPSYPPLEMAACGKPVVTTTYANKTAERLAQISPNIIGVPATIEAVAQGLLKAMSGGAGAAPIRQAPLALPKSWTESLTEVAPRLGDALATLFETSAASRKTAQLRTSLSLTTTVWNTDPSFLSALADSVFGQDCEASFEWIVLDNGSVRPDTIEYLAHLGQHDSVRLMRVEQNIGIVGGQRHCLERAKNDYVVPIDSDDILTTDAFRRLAEALDAPVQPAYVFSDEDILENTRPVSHIRRTEFDPVLNSCDSYIWHLCAFRRSRALELNAYTDASAEYCHDWDTITRFADAGERIRHIPYVLYHWRSHVHSSSNSGGPHSGSMTSTKWLMQRTIAGQSDPGLYEIALFPISRGVDQYAIMRKPTAPLKLCLLYVGEDDGAGTAAAKLGAPVQETYVVHLKSDPPSNLRRDILDRLSGSKSDAVVLMTEGHAPRDESGIWDAMLVLELHADVAAVAGRITGKYGEILSACTSPAAELTATPSWVGLKRIDPGAHALALKRQTASAMPSDYFICRTGILRAAVAGDIANLEPSLLAERIGKVAQARGMRIAYSPLVEAVRRI
jgi:hypothetical protein